jgi:exopolysaccharide production protein ExoZ
MSKIPSNPRDVPIYLVATVLFLPGLPFVRIRPLMDFSWTLSFILLFYFIEGALAQTFRSLALPRLTRLAVLISAGLLWAFAGDVYGWWEPRTAIFWVGMALLESVEAMESRRPAWEKRIVPIASTLIVAGVFMRTALMLRHPNTGPLSIMFWRFVVTSVTLSSLVWVARFGPVWWKRMLASRQLCRLGAASYSFYLTHGLTIKAFRFGFIPWLGPAASNPLVFWCGQVLGLGLSILIARAAYRYVEGPLSNFAAIPSRGLFGESRGEAPPAWFVESAQPAFEPGTMMES